MEKAVGDRPLGKSPIIRQSRDETRSSLSPSGESEIGMHQRQSFRARDGLLIAGLSVALLAGGCSSGQKLTAAMVESAKQECGAADAYLMPSGRDIGFRGTRAEHVMAALCMAHALKNTDLKSIGYISAPPAGS